MPAIESANTERQTKADNRDQDRETTLRGWARSRFRFPNANESRESGAISPTKTRTETTNGQKRQTKTRTGNENAKTNIRVFPRSPPPPSVDYRPSPPAHTNTPPNRKSAAAPIPTAIPPYRTAF